MFILLLLYFVCQASLLTSTSTIYRTMNEVVHDSVLYSASVVHSNRARTNERIDQSTNQSINHSHQRRLQMYRWYNSSVDANNSRNHVTYTHSLTPYHIPPVSTSPSAPHQQSKARHALCLASSSSSILLIGGLVDLQSKGPRQKLEIVFFKGGPDFFAADASVLVDIQCFEHC
jgi:hypothetical protein